MPDWFKEQAHHVIAHIIGGLILALILLHFGFDEHGSHSIQPEPASCAPQSYMTAQSPARH